MSSASTKKHSANGLGSIRKRKRKRKDGSVYEFWEGRVTTCYDPSTRGQKQISVTGESQEEVVRRMREILSTGEKKEVKAAPVEASNNITPASLTLNEWADTWIDGLVGVKASSLYIYQRDLKLYIIPYFGKMELQKIEKGDVKRWIKKLSEKGLSPKTVKDLHGVLHKLLEEAVEEKKIVCNQNPLRMTPVFDSCKGLQGYCFGIVNFLE